MYCEVLHVMYMYHVHASAHRGQNRVLDPLELELWKGMSHQCWCLGLNESNSERVHCIGMSTQQPWCTCRGQNILQSQCSPHCGSVGIRAGKGLYPVSPLAVWHRSYVLSGITPALF